MKNRFIVISGIALSVHLLQAFGASTAFGTNAAHAQVSANAVASGQPSKHISSAITSNTSSSIVSGAVTEASAPPSVIGDWIPPDRDVVIRIHPCAGETTTKSICAELVRHAYSNLSTKDVLNPNPSLRDRPLNGVDILADLKAKGRDNWKGGKLYDPRTGKSYFPKLKLLGPDTIKLTGCIGPGLCRGYIWERATEDVTLIAQDIEKLQETTTQIQ